MVLLYYRMGDRIGNTVISSFSFPLQCLILNTTDEVKRSQSQHLSLLLSFDAIAVLKTRGR